MGLYIKNSLNRIALIDDDEDEDEDEDYYYEISESKKIEKLTKKHQVSISIQPYNDYSSYYFVIHNSIGMNIEHLYSGGFLPLPTVQDDPTFLQRSKDFIKEASEFFEQFKSLDFGEPEKRMFVSS